MDKWLHLNSSWQQASLGSRFSREFKCVKGRRKEERHISDTHFGVLNSIETAKESVEAKRAFPSAPI
jgi:hypothetical protein